MSAFAGPANGRYRLRLTVEAQSAFSSTIGTITPVRAVAGGSYTWMDRLSSALEIGPALRRISLSDELTSHSWGASAVAELSWRLTLVEEWALALGARAAATSFSTDGFLWVDVAAFCAIQRKFEPLRRP
jgi:hypothetical protein